MVGQPVCRYDNRSQQIPRAAAGLFSSRGLDATSIRDACEEIFRRRIDDLPVAGDVDRTCLRRTLPGAINRTLIWYWPGGDDPAAIAGRIVRLPRHGAENPIPARS